MTKRKGEDIFYNQIKMSLFTPKKRPTGKMMKHNIIKPLNSEYHYHVVVVKKKSGDMRFAVDYRQLKKMTKLMSFPLSRHECVFDTIG